MSTITGKAKALLDAVDFDQHGRIVAGKYVGGNGGLISRETMEAADALRKALATDQDPAFPDTPSDAQMALAFDFCAEINRSGGIGPAGLLSMAKRLYQVGAEQ